MFFPHKFASYPLILKSHINKLIIQIINNEARATTMYLQSISKYFFLKKLKTHSGTHKFKYQIIYRRIWVPDKTKVWFNFFTLDSQFCTEVYIFRNTMKSNEYSSIIWKSAVCSLKWEYIRWQIMTCAYYFIILYGSWCMKIKTHTFEFIFYI